MDAYVEELTDVLMKTEISKDGEKCSYGDGVKYLVHIFTEKKSEGAKV